MTWDATGKKKRVGLPLCLLHAGLPERFVGLPLCLLHAGLPERFVGLEPEVDLADDPAEEPGVQLLGQGVPAV